MKAIVLLLLLCAASAYAQCPGGSTTVTTWAGFKTAVTAGGTVCVTANLTATETYAYTSANAVAITTNGNVYTISSTFTTGPIMTMTFGTGSTKTVTITKIIFANGNNGGSALGGALVLTGSPGNSDKFQLTFTDVSFVNNRNTFASGRGGAISLSYSTFVCTRCIFSGNQATGTGSFGGAVNIDGGDNTFSSSTFTSNSAASSGGAISFEQKDQQVGTSYIVGSTFTSNTAPTGPALYLAASNVNIGVTVRTSLFVSHTCSASTCGVITLKSSGTGVSGLDFVTSSSQSTVGTFIYGDAATAARSVVVLYNSCNTVTTGGLLTLSTPTTATTFCTQCSNVAGSCSSGTKGYINSCATNIVNDVPAACCASPKFQDGASCVTTCPSPRFGNSNNLCVATCPSSTYGNRNTRTCVSSTGCPSGTTADTTKGLCCTTCLSNEQSDNGCSATVDNTCTATAPYTCNGKYDARGVLASGTALSGFINGRSCWVRSTAEGGPFSGWTVWTGSGPSQVNYCCNRAGRIINDNGLKCKWGCSNAPTITSQYSYISTANWGNAVGKRCYASCYELL